MGKASSAKKVQRAARAGGKTKGQRKNVAFPVALVAIVLLGVGLVAFARTTNPGDGSPKLGEHWHASYGVYVCDRWVADLSDRGPDKLGIHTHDDGLIHIHPFLAGAAGEAATMGKFLEQVGMEVTGSSITLPPGEQFRSRKYVNGDTTCGGKKARVVAAHWENSLETDKKPSIRTSGISDEHFDADLGAYTIAFLPEGVDVPPPPSAATILEGAAVDGGGGAPAGGDVSPEDLQQQFSPTGGAGVTPGDPGTGVPPEGGEVLPPDPAADPEAPSSEPAGEAPPAEGDETPVSEPAPEGDETPPAEGGSGSG